MTRNWKLAGALALVVVILAGISVAGKNWFAQFMQRKVEYSTQAALYALPLVITDLTRQATFSHPAAVDATPNRFYNIPVIADATFRAVVRPNVDTIYSTAWLDLKKEPVVVTIPPSNGRYFVVQFMDAWTNVFAAPGVRTLGNSPSRFAIVGPGWKGKVPDGIPVVHAPTRTAWVIARVYVRDPADLTAARAFQSSLDIRPLSRLGDATFKAAIPRAEYRYVKSPVMMDQLKHLGAAGFYERFMALTIDNPPPAADDDFIKTTLNPLGLVVGERKSWRDINPLERKALTIGYARVLDALSSRSKTERSRTPTGWSGMPGPFPLGVYGTDYKVRAVVAAVGLGANLRADAVYLNSSVDGKGRRLDGSKAYRIVFPKGATPPILGFWSVTMYDDRGYLTPNAIHRFAIKPGDPLVYEPDGSLVIYIQPNDPGPEHRANWLPSPGGMLFDLSLRCYWPKPVLLRSEWMPPPIVPVN